MCGIAGIFSLERDRKINTRMLQEMTEAVRHRGPDDAGYLCAARGAVYSYSEHDSTPSIRQRYVPLDHSVEAFLGFGFRRLAILDLGESGHQPMSDFELGLHIVFNGEIYNHIELRNELRQAGYSFHSSSDTEVILKSYHHWGEACLERFNGIWAFALWDEKRGKLFCSRDRFGVKPFYYALKDGFLYFGSELKQLLLTPIGKELNHTMIWRSMKINAMLVYDGETFWQQIKALPAGSNLLAAKGNISIECYYELDPAAFETSRRSFKTAAQTYREHFLRAVDWQMRSDVEVGACLSGGLDSSAIVCAAANLAEKPLQTFSSWFPEVPALDERHWIGEVAKSSNSISHLCSPSAEEALSWFSDATHYNDLPVGSGFAAQYAVMRQAQGKGIKVLLDGQGSDELTAGYRHAQYRYLADLIRKGKLVNLLKDFPAYLKSMKPAEAAPALLKSLLSALLPEARLYQLEFLRLRFEPFNTDFIHEARSEGRGAILSKIADLRPGRLSSFLYNMIYTTSLQTLLHYEDRMSMAAGIESRVPFLDHELVELAFSLPSSYKVKPPQGKMIHRQAMQPIVPKAIYERKDKAIFGSPLTQVWLRRELRNWVESIFASAVFRRRGIWNLPLINTHWRRYLRGDNSQAEMLFNILALEVWLRRMVDANPTKEV